MHIPLGKGCFKVRGAIEDPIQYMTEMTKRIILKVDNRVAMVVLDKKEYLEKAETLLAQLAYRTIDKYPTNKLKARLIQTLRRIKRATNTGEGMYRTMYPTGCTAQKFSGLPKIRKTGTSQANCIPAGTH